MNKNNALIVYAIAFILLFLAMIFGYVGFLWYVTQSKDIASGYSLYLVAVFAAIATFFSPCSFGLLPGYLSYYYTVRKKREEEKEIMHSLYYGSIASLGLVTFNIIIAIIVLVLGVGIANAFSVAGGGGLSGLTIGIRLLIGILLLVLGISQLLHLTFISLFFHKISRFASVFQGEKGTAFGLYAYGFGYNLGNVGCTGPILGGLIVLSLASGINATILAFLIYSTIMAVLMISVSLLVGLAEEKTVKDLSAKTPMIQKISALVLTFVGLFILLTALFPEVFVSLFFPK